MMLLLISLLVCSSGCSSLKEPVKNVKFEIVKAADMPAGAKVRVSIEGDQAFLLDAPGSKEVALKAEAKRKVTVILYRLTPDQGPSIYLNKLHEQLRIYVDGKEVDCIRSPGVEQYGLSFVLEKVEK